MKAREEGRERIEPGTGPDALADRVQHPPLAVHLKENLVVAVETP